MFNPSVYDLLEHFGCYVGELEGNLQMDPDNWAAYEEDPVPFIVDMLCDFGEFGDYPVEEHREIAQRAAQKWWSP